MKVNFFRKAVNFLWKDGQFSPPGGKFLLDDSKFSLEGGNFLLDDGKFSLKGGKFLLEACKFDKNAVKSTWNLSKVVENEGIDENLKILTQRRRDAEGFKTKNHYHF